MRNPIELCQADLSKDLFSTVVFFSLAEGGAMGEPGAVLFYLDNGELYHFNYVYGDVEIKTVQKMFVPLSKCKFGMFGLDSSAPKGWNYVNLGMGNHLIVRDDMIAPFMEQIGEDAEPSKVYMKWMEVAEEILSKNRK